jgi:hypothetical protein
MGRNNADFSNAMDGVGPEEQAWLAGKMTDDEAFEAVTRKKPTRTKNELKQQGRQENDSSAERYHELRGE